MKTTLVIGASSGIGKTLANILHKKGEKVIAISRSVPEAAYSAYYEHDILSSAELPKLEDAIDGLVYCPGSINLKPFRTLKEQDFENDFKLNVLGAIKSIQAYHQNLLLSKHASIVLFSTVAVQTGMPFHSSVSTSKGAIEGLTKTLAAEFSPKIRVNCVAPSLTSSAMADKLINTPEKLDASNNRHPLKRIGNPEDISNTVEFLLSSNASWITGQILHVDGGMSTLKV
ncbi:MAG TPA: SDR family oxidoreductase [Bacteroidia bacterium]|nr:SDR family oxidoreductase [Bacteroidia bacterium]